MAHPLANQPRVRVEDIAAETMIARRSCEALAETSRFFTQRGVRPRFALRSENDDRALAMVRAGLGVTVASRSLDTNGIAMVDINNFRLKRTVGLVFGSHWASEFGRDHPIVRAIRSAMPPRVV